MSNKADLSVFDTMYQELGEDLGRSKFFYELFDGELDEVGYGSETDWREARKEQEERVASYGYVHIESEGGGEGEGEYCYGVIKFQDKYYKADWSYYSYDGCDYDYIEDTIREVTPVEKTITVFEAVK